MISVFDKPNTPHQAIFAMLAAFASGYCTAGWMRRVVLLLPQWAWLGLFGVINLANWLRRYFL